MGRHSPIASGQASPNSDPTSRSTQYSSPPRHRTRRAESPRLRSRTRGRRPGTASRPGCAGGARPAPLRTPIASGQWPREHCRVCAEACRRCERACRELLAAMR
ncbi:MAG: four-helix bundle copper-binding protein [Streptosporangiaceae bacterium]